MRMVPPGVSAVGVIAFIRNVKSILEANRRAAYCFMVVLERPGYRSRKNVESLFRQNAQFRFRNVEVLRKHLAGVVGEPAKEKAHIVLGEHSFIAHTWHFDGVKDGRRACDNRDLWDSPVDLKLADPNDA